MGRLDDRLARIEAMIRGPVRRTPEDDAQERRAEIARLYVRWAAGEIERPDLEDPEDARLWALMGSYEEAALRVADRVASKGTDDDRY